MVEAVRLVGREGERAVAAGVLERASHGNGALLLIHGEAGIGKSRLVTDISRDATAAGFGHISGRGIEFEKSRPFGMVTRMLRSSSVSGDPAVTDVFNLLTTANLSRPAADVRFQVIERVVEILENWAVREPVVVVAEDIQWSDDLSLTALSRVAERGRQVSLVAIFTSRAPEARLEQLLNQVDWPPVSRIVLKPLDGDSVKDLVHASCGAKPGPNLEAKLRGTEGNPLFVLELTAQLRLEGLLVIAHGVAEISSPALPSSFRAMVLLRLTHLGSGVLEVLRTGAVLSSVIEGDELAAILGLPQMEVVRRLEAAREGHVLADSEAGLRFRHDLIREALYDDMPASVRRMIHRQIAQVLLERGAEPGRVVTHLLRGSSAGDIDAIRAMIVTARRLTAASTPDAIALLERAVEIAPPLSPLRAEALAEIAWISTWAGEPDKGERIAHDLLRETVAPEVRSRAATALVRALMLQGKFDDLRLQLRSVMDDPSLAVAARSELVAEASLIASGPPAQHEYAEALANRVLASADASTTATCIALCALSYLRNFHGDVASSVVLARQALELAKSSQSTEALRRAPHYYLGGALMFVDEVEEAESLYREGAQVAEQLGAPWSLSVYHMLWGHLHLYTGQWDDAVAELEAAGRLANELGTMLQIIPTLALQVVISLHRGEQQSAREHLAAMARVADSAPLAPYYVPWARALFAHMSGDNSAAQREAASLHRVLRETDHLFAYRMVGLDLVRILLANGDRSSAGEVVVILEGLVPQCPAATPRAEALWARAMYEDDADLALLAVAGYRESPRPVERAWAMEDAAGLLAPRNKALAQQLLEEAMATYADVALAHDLRRAESTLRAWGVRRGARTRHVRATTGWDALTATETGVANLVAEGLSNPGIAQRLFISRRTVDAHLSHIYTKLDIGSRTQLVGEVVRRQQAD